VDGEMLGRVGSTNREMFLVDTRSCGYSARPRVSLVQHWQRLERMVVEASRIHYCVSACQGKNRASHVRSSRARDGSRLDLFVNTSRPLPCYTIGRVWHAHTHTPPSTQKSTIGPPLRSWLLKLTGVAHAFQNTSMTQHSRATATRKRYQAANGSAERSNSHLFLRTQNYPYTSPTVGKMVCSDRVT